MGGRRVDIWGIVSFGWRVGDGIDAWAFGGIWRWRVGDGIDAWDGATDSGAV